MKEWFPLKSYEIKGLVTEESIWDYLTNGKKDPCIDILLHHEDNDNE